MYKRQRQLQRQLEAFLVFGLRGAAGGLAHIVRHAFEFSFGGVVRKRISSVERVFAEFLRQLGLTPLA